jgi:hypothetical protein
MEILLHRIACVNLCDERRTCKTRYTTRTSAHQNIILNMWCGESSGVGVGPDLTLCYRAFPHVYKIGWCQVGVMHVVCE